MQEDGAWRLLPWCELRKRLLRDPLSRHSLATSHYWHSPALNSASTGGWADDILRPATSHMPASATFLCVRIGRLWGIAC